MEVAIRALSPGVNDPFTALECIDQLTAGAVSLARRHDPLPYAFDSDGVLRLLFPTVGFESFVRRVFARLRPHAGRDRMAALRLMGAVERVLAQTTSADRRLVLRREARALLTTVSRHLDRPDRDDVRRVFEGLFGPPDSGEGSRMERSG